MKVAHGLAPALATRLARAKCAPNPPSANGMRATNGLPRICRTPWRCPGAPSRFPRLLQFANAAPHPGDGPRAPATATWAGCVPVQGGIVLSLERMNRIKEINAARLRGGRPTRRAHPEACRTRSRSAGPVLSARPGQPGRLQHRRQHRHQRRRPALPEVRRHPRLRARAGGGAGRRHGHAAGQPHPQEQDRLRPGAGCSSARRACWA